MLLLMFINVDEEWCPWQGDPSIQCISFSSLGGKQHWACCRDAFGWVFVPPLQTPPHFLCFPAHQVPFNILCNSCSPLLPVSLEPSCDLPSDETGCLLQKLPLLLLHRPFINECPCGGKKSMSCVVVSMWVAPGHLLKDPQKEYKAHPEGQGGVWLGIWPIVSDRPPSLLHSSMQISVLIAQWLESCQLGVCSQMLWYFLQSVAWPRK